MPMAKMTMARIESRPRRTKTRLVAHDHAEGVDGGERDAEHGEPGVEVPGCWQDGLARDEVGDEEQAQLERVAAEDVRDRELVIAEPYRGDTRADLGERRGDREDGRAEDDAVDVGAVGEVVAGYLEDHAGTERDQTADPEHDQRPRRRLGDRRRLLVGMHLSAVRTPRRAPGHLDLPCGRSPGAVEREDACEPDDDDREGGRTDRSRCGSTPAAAHPSAQPRRRGPRGAPRGPGRVTRPGSSATAAAMLLRRRRRAPSSASRCRRSGSRPRARGFLSRRRKR